MNKHIIDRSNLAGIVSYNPETKISKTLMDSLSEHYMTRADIVLVNGLRTGKQYSVYASEHGFSGDTFVLDFLTDEEFRKVNEIADRMRQNAKEYPVAKKLLISF